MSGMGAVAQLSLQSPTGPCSTGEKEKEQNIITWPASSWPAPPPRSKLLLQTRYCSAGPPCPPSLSPLPEEGPKAEMQPVSRQEPSACKALRGGSGRKRGQDCTQLSWEQRQNGPPDAPEDTAKRQGDIFKSCKLLVNHIC